MRRRGRLLRRSLPSRERGTTLLELTIGMAIFGMFLTVLFLLTAEMHFYEKRLPLNMHKHPQVISVLARMRRDVLDAHGKSPYRDQHDGYVASGKVLILETISPAGGAETVIWDFRTAGEVRRRAYVASLASDQWVARGLPLQFSTLQVDAIKTAGDAAWATHIQATDEKGRIVIDAILQPRATE